jgi:chemotaxis protein histidine kinase CheA
MGFLVDKIHHQADLVIKPFARFLKKTRGFKGNSVLTDDRVAYVIEAAEIQSLMQKEKP